MDADAPAHFQNQRRIEHRQMRVEPGMGDTFAAAQVDGAAQFDPGRAQPLPGGDIGQPEQRFEGDAVEIGNVEAGPAGTKME